jgi:hypothetical protein
MYQYFLFGSGSRSKVETALLTDLDPHRFVGYGSAPFLMEMGPDSTIIGTVPVVPDFGLCFFFHESTPYGLLNHTQFFFSILISSKYSNLYVVLRGIIPRRIEGEKLGWRTLSAWIIWAPWVVQFLHAQFKRKCPFNGTSKLPKIIDMILLGNEQASRMLYPSKQLSEQISQGIIPLLTDFCRVSHLS